MKAYERVEHRSPHRPFVVWSAGVSWGDVVGTDRHMATALTRYADVLWIDRPLSPLTVSGRRHGVSRSLFPELTCIDDSLFRLSPKTVPFYSRGILRPVSDVLTRQQIRYAVNRIGRRPTAFVASHFGDVLPKRNRPGVNVLYGTDDFVGGAELMGVARHRIEYEESRQLSRVDLVVAISSELAHRWQERGFKGRIALIPNGVDVDGYRDMGNVVPADVQLPRPIAGLVGHLSSRIDIGLLESVVSSGCSLLMVGPRDPRWEPIRFERLLTNPRVAWTGRVEFARLASYLKVMDVGLTPYADSAFNRASFPLKTLEYLAAGKPVVSTDLPSVRWLGTDLIDVASAESFGKATLRAATQAGADLARRRIAFAESHSWAQRARTFAETIGISEADRA